MKPKDTPRPRFVLPTAAILVLSSSALEAAAPNEEARCQAAMTSMTGDLVACLHDAASREMLDLERGRSPGESAATCNRLFESRYSSALERWGTACPGYAESVEAAYAQADQLVGIASDSVTASALVVAGQTASAPADGVRFFNNCKTPVKLMSDASVVDGVVIPPQDTHDFGLQDFGSGGRMISAAPVTTQAQCLAVGCTDWSDIQATGQRMGYMWQAPNLSFAAYCQPTNAAVQQCTGDANTPCCGPTMNFDRTFGTTFEIAPNAFGGQDFVDLSTNYGSGPNSPPPLCNGSNPDDCVTANANIFFNLPIQIALGQECSCGTLGTRRSITCTEVACTDAYQYPTDPKQCACSATPGRGYVVTYCPDGSPLPSID